MSVPRRQLIPSAVAAAITGATTLQDFRLVAPQLQLKIPGLDEIRAEKMRRKFSGFVKEAWNVIEPSTPLLWNWHLDALCDHIAALVTGKLGRNNLIINVPPGSMKSTIVSVCLLPWIWTFRPEYRALFASGNPRVSSRDSVKCRMILESSWYQDTFKPGWKFRRDQNEKLEYTNTKTGARLATTTGAVIIGSRYHGLFVDDALDATKAFSDTEVEGVNTWWDNSLWNRVNDENGVRCIIGQRLRKNDLPGYVIGRDGLDVWAWLCIPQEFELPGEGREARPEVTTLGWRDPRTVEGELMFPARFSAEWVVLEKIVLGSSAWTGQHQQRPSLLEGEIFKRGHAQFIHPNQIPPASIAQTITSLDSAIKEGQQNDYSVSLVGQQFDRGVLIRAEFREKVSYTGLKEAVLLQNNAWKPHAVLIEDKASGQQIIQEFQQNTSLPIVPISVSTDKVTRASVVVPYWEANRVFFPCDEFGNPEAWVGPFLEELYDFPKAPHDDRVDAFTQLLNYLTLASGPRGLIEYYRQQLAKDKAESEAQRREDAVHHTITTIRLGGAV